jgi:hypothetical protein
MDTQGVEFHIPRGSIGAAHNPSSSFKLMHKQRAYDQVLLAQPFGEDLKLSSVESPY